METMMPAVPPQTKTAGVARRLARLLRRKRSPSGADMAYSVAGDEFEQSLDSSINSLSKLKLSGNLAAAAYSIDASSFFKNAAAVETKKKGAAAAEKKSPAAVPTDAAKHAFVASLFAGSSAVKAAYAQLQLAQRPYDAESIQAADAGLVAELTRLSELKRRYARDPVAAAAAVGSSGALAAQADEQRHLLRTYEITARKLEAELRAREAEAASLADEVRRVLEEEEEEERARPGRSTLAALDRLHLSGLNATHLLTALRHTVKSVRTFARTMLDATRAAGWDPAAAGAAVHPGVVRLRRRPDDAKVALESYVALKLFAGFHRKDLGLASLRGRHHDRRRFFFDEFAELRSAPAATFLDTSDKRWAAFHAFLRDRYLSVVHERMESAFFGRSDQRAAVEASSAGEPFPRTAWFAGFAEAARCVWMLHCLFCALDDASVFQARPGSRFSEVYMESVGDVVDGGHLATTVGFTVVPGFKVGQTVIQCRVYLS